MKKINEIFRMAREVQGITQQELVDRIETDTLTHSAISHFEAGKANISTKKLRSIAKVLSLNPDFAEDATVNPFKNTTGVIKMFATEGKLFKTLEPLYFVSQFNRRIRLLSLIAPPEVINKLYSKLGIPWIFAVAFSDDEKNIFLLRGRKDLINLAVDWPVLMTQIIRSKCVFSVAQQEASKDLFDKIKTSDALSRDDIEPLFLEVNFDNVNRELTDNANKELTDNEEEQLEIQRKYAMKPLSELDLIIIRSMREEKVSHEEILNFIKSKRSLGS